MEQAADLSKIVNVIMQNPDLIAKISSLVNAPEGRDEKPTVENASVPIESPDDRSEAAPTFAPTSNKARRKELLNAMKPYLSEQRRGAIDSMSSILDILDVMARKESQ